VQGALSQAVKRQFLHRPLTGHFDAVLLRAWAEEALSGRRLIIVSNREPYSHVQTGDDVRVLRNPGGLVVALDAVLRATGGVWVAHGSGNADPEHSDSAGRVRVPVDAPAYTLARTWLSQEEQDGYYSGFSNGALWPLCHVAYVRPRFELSDWDQYEAVNRKFARAVLGVAGSARAVVLLQDYHLGLCAKFIKAERPDIPVGLFWHIPWPNPEIFRILPWKVEVLGGLLANDLLGFHLRYHGMNFLDTVSAELEARVDLALGACVSDQHRCGRHRLPGGEPRVPAGHGALEGTSRPRGASRRAGGRSPGLHEGYSGAPDRAAAAV